MTNMTQRDRELLARLADTRRRIETLDTINYITSPANDIALVDGVSAPTAVSGLAFIYVDSADGDLKIRFGDGTTKTIVTDT